VTFLYFALPFRWRWAMLLIASSIFYMAFIPAYILILFFTITVDYCAGLLIDRAQGGRRKLFLIASIILNVGVLGFFKYFDFISNNLTHAAQALGWQHSLPVLSLVHDFQNPDHLNLPGAEKFCAIIKDDFVNRYVNQPSAGVVP
jgi:alginate O-acetyltransferase complex protein AlgI